jgi:hypothetical protein
MRQPSSVTSMVESSPPAFPSGSHNVYHPGLTLRDYFAAQTLPEAIVIANATRSWPSDGMSQADVLNAAAKLAFEIADAMLAARSR